MSEATGPSAADFDAVYRGDFQALHAATDGPGDFELDRVPWDIHEAQPVVRELEAGGGFSGEVLDLGCGPGENTLMLAERGHRVLGLDGSPAAVEIARGRARERGLSDKVTFEVADAFALDSYDGRFDTVLDSALYHCFDEAERHHYVASVHRVCRPHAKLHIVCFSDRVPETFPGPYRIDEGNLRDTLTAAGWVVRRLEPATYTTAFTRDDLAHLRSGQPADALSSLGTDEHGRFLAPAWLATAERG